MNHSSYQWAWLALVMATLNVAHAAPVPTVEEVAGFLGFGEAEIGRIASGEIVTKELHEGSAEELAGVVAGLFPQPVAEVATNVLEGLMLKADPSVQKLHGWKPDDAVDDALKEVGLEASETKEVDAFLHAAPGSALNLSPAEIESFQRLRPPAGAPGPETLRQVNTELRALLKARYVAYRRAGLGGIPAYARAAGTLASPSDELRLALKESIPAGWLEPAFQSLLNYPSDSLPNVEHWFNWVKRVVEDRPTFILVHRAGQRGARAALLVERQYYVSHSYNSNFIAAGVLQVTGGTLVFYCDRTFTDQVAGLGRGLKHRIGRSQMLGVVAANLQRVRERMGP